MLLTETELTELDSLLRCVLNSFPFSRGATTRLQLAARRRGLHEAARITDMTLGRYRATYLHHVQLHMASDQTEKRQVNFVTPFVAT